MDNSDIKPPLPVGGPEKVLPTRGENSEAIENTKFEYRNAKQISNSNVQMLKTGKTKVYSLVITTDQTVLLR
jgi:hypothetical protein